MGSLRYAAYIRKSTEDEERQVLSKEAQRDKIKERFSDLKIVAWIDESKSAFEPDKRDGFKRLIDMFDSGEIDGIVAWHPDRLSRNEVDASTITWRIRQGIIKDLKFASFSFDNSPEGLMMLQMTMSQSQYFSAKLSKDVKRGNEQKRKNGGICGAAPEGYVNDRINKIIEIDPLRFPLLRQAFDMYLTGNYSIQEVLRYLNEDCSYRTRKHNIKGGGPLSYASLYYMFRNERYAGWIPDPNNPDLLHKAAHTPMITMEEYDRVQALLGRKGCTRLATRKQFALRGLVRCGKCGGAITAEEKIKRYKSGKTKIYIYYHCTLKRPCNQRIYISQDNLYKQVTELLDHYELIPQLYEWGIDALKEMAEKEVAERNDVQTMQTQSIVQIQAKLDKLLDMATDRLIDDATYEAKSIALKSELKSLQSQQADTAERVKNWYEFTSKTLKTLTHANTKFVDGDLADKKEILMAIGQNPLLLDGKLSLTSNEWMVPIETVAKRMRFDLESARTMPEQRRNKLLAALHIEWCGWGESNSRFQFGKLT